MRNEQKKKTIKKKKKSKDVKFKKLVPKGVLKI